MAVKEMEVKVAAAGAPETNKQPEISVGPTGMTLKGFELRVGDGVIHLNLIGLGITLNLPPRMALWLTQNLDIAYTKLLQGDNAKEKLGLIKQLPDVRLRVNADLLARDYHNWEKGDGRR